MVGIIINMGLRLRRVLVVCAVLVLFLSVGSETRPLKATMVSNLNNVFIMSRDSRASTAVAADQEGPYDHVHRLSPGGPDPHHH